MTHNPPRIAVVGSTNVDLVAYATRTPGAGETVLGTDFRMEFGGKGANQAVMARCLGANVAFVGAVGSDDFSTMTKGNFAALGIDTRHLAQVPGPSGVAPIWVEPDGTNRIIVVPGANGTIAPESAAAAIDALAAEPGATGAEPGAEPGATGAEPGAEPSATGPEAAAEPLRVVVGQLEIPQGATAAAFIAARRHGAVTILNPAPAAPLLPELLAAAEWLIPNEHEFALLGGGSSNATDDEIRAFAATTGRRIIVTLGVRGVALLGPDGVVHRIPAPRVTAVDTTGAGDAFVGGFAFGLASGLAETEAAALGIRCASDSVLRPGAQGSFARGTAAEAILAGPSPSGLGSPAGPTMNR